MAIIKQKRQVAKPIGSSSKATSKLGQIGVTNITPSRPITYSGSVSGGGAGGSAGGSVGAVGATGGA